MPIIPVPWAGRKMPLLDAARQPVPQIRRWLPGRHTVMVADSALAFLAGLPLHARVVGSPPVL